VLATDVDQDGLAQALFARTFYQRHPYRLPAFDQTKSVEHLTPAALAEHHQSYHNPARMTLCVVGDVKAGRVLALARDVFGKPGRSAARPPEVPIEPPPERQRWARHPRSPARSPP